MRIKIDGIGAPIKKMIADKLVASNVPGCLGNMCPKIIEATINIEESAVLRIQESIKKELVEIDNIVDVLIDDKNKFLDYSKYALTKEGFDKISGIKESSVEEYVNQVIMCTQCKYVDVCNKLTQNYIMNIYIKVLEQRA